MNKYCIRVSRMIEVENLKEVDVFKKMDFMTKEVLEYYLVTKDKEQYQIDEKTYKKILDDREPDLEQYMKM